MSITSALHDHHKQCDDLFANAELKAQERHWPECASIFRQLMTELEAHFMTEEQVLFPAFEQASGSAMGPTQVMRLEHTQMRELLSQMNSAIGRQDGRQFSGEAETLLILMQQHNLKEENILYPMCNRVLGHQDLALEAAIAERRASVCLPS